jgi:hypothetical protein
VSRLLSVTVLLLAGIYSACGYGDDDDDDPLVGPRGETDTVSFEDLVIEVPEEWDSDSEDILRVASFELDSDGRTDVPRDDVLMRIGGSVPGCDPGGLPQNLPVVVQQLDLVAGVACYAFVTEGEFLEDEPTYELLVEFGSESPAPRLLDEVNNVLATLEVE